MSDRFYERLNNRCPFIPFPLYPLGNFYCSFFFLSIARHIEVEEIKTVSTSEEFW